MGEDLRGCCCSNVSPILDNRNNCGCDSRMLFFALIFLILFVN